VVAIIGLLAAIAIPKFANMVVKAKEAAIKGKMGALRSALSIYYADNEGNNPTTNLSASLVPRYIEDIPIIALPNIAPGHLGKVDYPYNGITLDFEFETQGIAWAWNNVNSDIRVNCTHTDSKGTTWSLW
jgi:type II secretory pathway pseudopilin PulG